MWNRNVICVFLFFFSPPTPFPRCNWNSQCPDNPHIMFYAILIVIILNPVLGLLQWKLYSPIILQKSVCFFFCRLTSFCTPQITERSMAFQPCEYLWGVVGWALHLAGHSLVTLWGRFGSGCGAVSNRCESSFGAEVPHKKAGRSWAGGYGPIAVWDGLLLKVVRL